MSPSASEKSLHLSVKPLRSSFYVVHVERIDLFHFAFHVCVELFRSTCVYLVTLPSHSHQASWRAFLVNSFFESLCAERSSLNWVTSAGKGGGGLSDPSSTQNSNFLIFQGEFFSESWWK